MRYVYFRRLLSLSVYLALISLSACTQVPVSAPTAGPLSDTSIYQMEANWQTDGGDTLTLAALRGQPVALALVYADCGTACPLIIQDLKALGARADAAGVPLRYVLVTLNPALDTPARLRVFRQTLGLDERWTLLRGTDDDVLTLAALLGVRYRRDLYGTIAHSNLITLLDAGGDLVVQQEGVGTDPAPTVAALQTSIHPTR